MDINRLRWMLLGNTVLLACILFNQFMPVEYGIITLAIGFVTFLTVLVNCFMPTDKEAENDDDLNGLE